MNDLLPALTWLHVFSVIPNDGRAGFENEA